MPNWIESLFKFRPAQFAEGAFGWQVGAGWIVVVVFVLVLLAGLVWTFVQTQAYRRAKDRAVSFGLRLAALLLLCIPLFEPVLITPDVIPDENFVAVLVDVSDSMTIPDGALGETRLDDAAQLLAGEDSFVPGLEELFNVRYYTFGEAVSRVDSLGTQSGAGQTHLTDALERVMQDFAGVPLAGVVVLSDGGDNSPTLPINAAEE